MTVAVSGDSITFPDNSVQATAPKVGMVNRIINGAMVIDQRNAGASGTADGYTIDRFAYYGVQASKGTWQQNAGAVTPPTGFTNYLGFTSSSAYSVLAGDLFEFYQFIEGYNFADLNWGTANAATVTVLFWVRSSLTGTFGAGLTNSGNTRNYPFTYTISSANTWEQKSITIAGDTSGTWLTTNGRGVGLVFNLGAGSDFSTTANAWNGTTSKFMPTGATSVVGTSGATFYITGVQLEKGSTATSFDYRPYGTELGLCQRYFAKLQNDGAGGDTTLGVGMQQSTTGAWVYLNYPATMRSEPTVAISSMAVSDQIGFTNAATLGAVQSGYNSGSFSVSYSAAGAQYRPICLVIVLNTAGFIALSAEL